MSTSTVLPFTTESNESAGAIERYRQSYRLAQNITEFAEKVKLGGIVVGGVCVVVASVAGQWTWRHSLPVASFSLLAFAIVAVLAAHIWEKVFQAQGRMLEMGIDSAVNSSPFLSNRQRAVAMSLRHEARNLSSIEQKLA